MSTARGVQELSRADDKKSLLRKDAFVVFPLRFHRLCLIGTFADCFTQSVTSEFLSRSLICDDLSEVVITNEN